jgi:uncharacterized integral membrane protein
MRIVIAFLVGILTAAVVAALGVLVVQNTQSEQFTFLGATFSGDKGGVVAGAAAVGFILAVLLLLPGRLASAWHRAHSHRQTRTLEQRLLALGQEHAQLHGGHQRLVEEHGLVLDRVLPAPATPATLASLASLASPRLPTPQAGGHTSQTAPQTSPQTVPLATGGEPADTPVAATADPVGAQSR